MDNPESRTIAVAPSKEQLAALCSREHTRCFACRPASAGGLGLAFALQPDGSVSAEWTCPPGYESYPGVLHGGLIATALDSAMVHALFARGIVARTGELTVRYRHSVDAGQPILVRAWVGGSYPPLFQLEAELSQNGRVSARAHAKFMETPNQAP